MKLKLTFLGTGTSGGVPDLLCGCPVCLSRDPKNRRLRSSAFLEIERDGRKTFLLIDTTPDFRQQVLLRGVRRIDAILYTHGHYDHVGGLDDIRPFNRAQGGAIPAFADPGTVALLRHRYDYFFNAPQTGGGLPSIDFREVTGPFEFDGVRIAPLEVIHGIIPVLGYRIGRFAYITDASSLPPATLEAIGGLDLLVLNAIRFKPHSTHFNLEQALGIVDRVRPKKAFLIHITDAFDHAKVNRSLPRNVRLAYDGQAVDLSDV